MDIKEVESGRGAPMAEEAWLDVVKGERVVQEGIVFEVDLAHRKIVGGPPISIHAGEHFSAERSLVCCGAFQLFRHSPPQIPGFRQ